MNTKLSKAAVFAFVLTGIIQADAQNIQGMRSRTENLPTPPTHFDSASDEESLVSFALQTGWASKYISEGVDAFGEGGLWEFNAEIAIENFIFTTWYGLSDSINAAELKLIGSYDIEWNSFTLTPSYEHSFAYPGAEDGDTPAIGLTYEFPDTGWVVGADIQWAVDGSMWRGYYDLFIEKSWDVTEDFNVAASILYAFNDGYLGEEVGHGSNTIDYSLTGAYQFLPGWSIIASVNYSQALTVLRQAERMHGGKFGDEFWVGTYIHFEF